MSVLGRNRQTLAAAGLAIAMAALIAGVAGATVVSKHFTVKALEDGANHSVKCAKGRLATSGGFKINQSGETSVEVLGSRPAGRKWVLSDRNVGHQDFTGKLLTLCAKDKGLVFRSKELTTAPTDTDVQVNAHCPKGSKAIGGGGGLTGEDSGLTELGSFPTNAGEAWGTRWRLPGTGSVGLAAYAVCDKRIRGYNVIEATGTIQTRSKRDFLAPATAVATCEGTDELAGGGWFRLDPQTWWTRVGPKGNGWEATGGVFSSSPSSVLSFAVCGK